VITAVVTTLASLATLLAQENASVPDEMGYVWASYALVVAVLAGYAVVTIRRGRAVGKRLPPDERRWM
jgi:heme exporter protein CcmD